MSPHASSSRRCQSPAAPNDEATPRRVSRRPLGTGFGSSRPSWCRPAWNDEFGELAGDGRLNLGNLTEQMLAGGYLYGATRVPWLHGARGPDGQLCDNVDANPDCIPSYSFDPMGCVYVKVDVVEAR